MKRLIPLLLSTLTIACASSGRYARLAVDDLTAVATAPAHASSRAWKQTAVAAGAVGAALLLDDEIASLARRNDGGAADSIADAVEPFGGGHSDKVIAGFLLYGMARGDDRARNVAFDAFVSSMLASKAITPALKAVLHRQRPGDGDDESFPSNHATQAFTVATVISRHYAHRPWVGRLAYAVATGVAFARVQNDDHWASDVVAGAAIGSFVGHTVVTTNERRRATWTVQATRRGVLIGASW
jgi:hypothetical protein